MDGRRIKAGSWIIRRDGGWLSSGLFWAAKALWMLALKLTVSLATPKMRPTLQSRHGAARRGPAKKIDDFSQQGT
jgi:hypothetical protein